MRIVKMTPRLIKMRVRFRTDLVYRAKVKARGKQYRILNPESHRASQRKYQANLRKSDEFRQVVQNYQLLRKLAKSEGCL